MLKIRLRRAGGRNHPFYRVVVVDSRKARDSRALEEIGYYNPIEKPFVINVDRERVTYWTERGAQVSPGLQGLLKRENSVHTARRVVETFEPEPVEVAPPKPKKKAKAAKAKDAETAAAGEAEAKPKKKTAKKAEAAPDTAADAKAEAKTEAKAKSEAKT
ncbi:MAG: 30S ribosomal protein S16, partial [Gemmatimonadota bacterium]